MEWAGAWQIGNVTATFLSAPLDPCVRARIHVHVHVVYACTAHTHMFIPGCPLAHTSMIYIYIHINTSISTPIVSNHKFTSRDKTLCVLQNLHLELLP